MVPFVLMLVVIMIVPVITVIICSKNLNRLQNNENLVKFYQAMRFNGVVLFISVVVTYLVVTVPIIGTDFIIYIAGAGFVLFEIVSLYMYYLFLRK